MDIDGVSVRPLDVATRLLFPMWQMNEGDEDVTIMRILVSGVGTKGSQEIVYDLVDRFDRRTATSAMARTTGYTATTAVRLLADGLWTESGVVPPERLGQNPACTKYMLSGLREHGIMYRSSEDPLTVPQR
jgi:saccharopine dehydrogenase-like NADP-dependent oxidoreductase